VGLEAEAEAEAVEEGEEPGRAAGAAAPPPLVSALATAVAAHPTLPQLWRARHQEEAWTMPLSQPPELPRMGRGTLQ